jgi:hypothetical protein
LGITPAKPKAAGIARAPHYSKKTKQYYILSAAEMWTYLTKTFRPPDKTFPPRGRYKDADEYADAYESEIKPAIEGKHGIVAFDKIFTYGGTGHVDLFQGEQDLGCRRLVLPVAACCCGTSDRVNRAFLAAVVALVACGGPDPTARDPGSPKTSSTTATEAKAPAMSDSQPAAQKIDWTVAQGKVGPIELGKPLPAVVLGRDLGQAYVARYVADGQPVDAFQLDDPPLLVILDKGPYSAAGGQDPTAMSPSDKHRAEAVEAAKAAAVRAVLVTGPGPHVSGVGVGSTLEELRRAFPDLKLAPVPETLGKDRCVGRAKSLPGVGFVFSSCGKADKGEPVLRVDLWPE